MDLYREHILDHYKNPRNKGSLKDPDITVSQSNSTCGDQITIYIKLEKQDPSFISDICFSSDGCAISTAAASMLMEKLKGKPVKDIEKLTDKDILNLLNIDISPGRINCAMLPLRALKKIKKRQVRGGE